MPAAFDDTNPNPEPDLADSDQDAEGEEDTDIYHVPPSGDTGGVYTPSEQLGAGENEQTPMNEDYSNMGINHETRHTGKQVEPQTLEPEYEEGDAVGAVKFPNDEVSSQNDDPDVDAAFENESGDEENEKSDKASSSDDSDGGDDDWEAESGRDDNEIEGPNPNNCM
jgi:histone acetyltransferase SAS3